MPVWGLLRTMMIPVIVPRRHQMGDQRTGTQRVLKASGEFGAGPSVIPVTARHSTRAYFPRLSMITVTQSNLRCT